MPMEDKTTTTIPTTTTTLPNKKRKNKKDGEKRLETCTNGNQAENDSSDNKIDVVVEFPTRSECVDYYRRLYASKTLRVDKEYSGSRQILLKCDVPECSFHLSFYKSYKDDQWRLSSGSRNNFEHVSFDEATDQWNECSGKKKMTRRELLKNEEIVDALQRQVSLPALLELSTNLGLPCSYPIVQRTRRLFKKSDKEVNVVAPNQAVLTESTESNPNITLAMLNTAFENEIEDHSLKETETKRAKYIPKKRQKQQRQQEEEEEPSSWFL